LQLLTVLHCAGKGACVSAPLGLGFYVFYVFLVV